MSINQTAVFFNPPVAMNAGQSHNNERNCSIYRTGVCAVATTPGVGLVFANTFLDHTKLVVAQPNAVNAAAALLNAGTNYVVLNHYQGTKSGMAYNRTITVLNSSTAPKSDVVYDANSYLLLKDSGIDYVVVEKQINPALPVFMRFQNPVGVNQGIGFFTDTASADVVQVPNTRWYGADTYTSENSIEPMTTVQYKNRIRLTNGFGLAPLALRFVPKT
jgi:hypothetical protein